MFTPPAFLPSLDKPDDSHTAPVLAVQISANYVVSSSADHFVRVWFKSSGDLALPPLGSYPKATVMSLEISEELGLVLGGDAKGNIVAWRLSDGERLLVEPAHNDYILSLALHDQTLASASRDQCAKVWTLEVTGNTRVARLQLRHTLQGHSMAVLAVKLHKSCTYTSSGDKSIQIWDTHSGTLLRSLREVASIAQFEIRKDTTGPEQLLSACTDGTIRLYDTDKGAELACLRGHTNVVCSVQILEPDPAHLGHIQIASASYDGTIRLWALLREAPFSWECLYTLSFSDAVVTSRSFSSQATFHNDPAREKERSQRALAAKREKKTSRALDMQVSSRYVYCCGESAQVIVWRLERNSNGLLRTEQSSKAQDVDEYSAN